MRRLLQHALAGPHTRPVATWWAVALAAKLAVAAVLALSLDLTGHFGFPGRCTIDCAMYTRCAELMVQTGTYALHLNDDGQPIPHTGRMPGYELVLAPALALTGGHVDAAYTLTLLLQLMLGAFAVVAWAHWAHVLRPRRGVFLGVLLGLGALPYLVVLDLTVLTESFALSAYAVGLYLVWRWPSRLTALLVAGFLGVWAVWLRQYLGPLCLLYPWVLWWQWGQKGLTRAALVRRVALLATLPLLMQGWWVLRNANAKGRFIPLVDDLHAGYQLPVQWRALTDFMEAWGGDIAYWNPASELAYFVDHHYHFGDRPPRYTDPSQFPSWIYTSAYNADSLRALPTFKATIYGEAPDDSALAAKLRHWIDVFKEERPFAHHVLARLRLMRTFLWHPGTFYLTASNTYAFADQRRPTQALHSLTAATHYPTVLLGVLGCLLLLGAYRRQPARLVALLVALCGLYIVVLCPWALRRVELRYLAPAYPYLVVAAVWMAGQVWDTMRGRQTRPTQQTGSLGAP